MENESATDTLEMPFVPEHLVAGMRRYILCGSLDTLPVHGVDLPSHTAWQGFREVYLAYTRSLGRILSHDERLALIVEASRTAQEQRQREEHLETTQKLPVPAQFHNPNVVSEEAWSYIEQFYQDRHALGHIQ